MSLQHVSDLPCLTNHKNSWRDVSCHHGWIFWDEELKFKLFQCHHANKRTGLWQNIWHYMNPFAYSLMNIGTSQLLKKIILSTCAWSPHLRSLWFCIWKYGSTYLETFKCIEKERPTCRTNQCTNLEGQQQSSQFSNQLCHSHPGLKFVEPLLSQILNSAGHVQKQMQRIWQTTMKDEHYYILVRWYTMSMDAHAG